MLKRLEVLGAPIPPSCPGVAFVRSPKGVLLVNIHMTLDSSSA